MYWTPPTDQWLAKFGGVKRKEDFPEPLVEVWEENWESLVLFSKVRNQLRVSANGPYALDYNVVYAELALMDIPKERQRELMADIRIMEPVALDEMTTPE